MNQPSEPGLGLTFSAMRVVLLLIAVAATACLMPAQADTYWHLRAGQDLFRTGHVPLVEMYSHTARGLPWPNHEWLWQALSFVVYRVGGMPLLVAVAAGCATLASALAFRLMRARPGVNFALALVGIPLASVVWALRPQVVSLLFLVLLIHLVIAERFWLVPFLFVVWANLHGAVALGGAVLLTATIVSWFGDRTRFRRMVLVTGISGLTTAFTPMGIGLWRFIGESMARSRRNQIMEWLPSYPRGPIEIAFWLGALALGALVLRRWRRLDSWEDRVIVAVALVLLPLAARAMRNISPFFLLWMPAMSRLIGPLARLPGSPTQPSLPAATASGPHARPTEVEHPRLNLALAAAAMLGAAITVVLCWARPIARLGWNPIPTAAATAISACPGRLYNRYNEGGYLIWFVPGVPVFIDSRQDPYPAALLSAHAAAERTGDYVGLFAQYGIGCAALPPSSPVAKHLVAAGWATPYHDDDWFVLYPPVAPLVLPDTIGDFSGGPIARDAIATRRHYARAGVGIDVTLARFEMSSVQYDEWVRASSDGFPQAVLDLPAGSGNGFYQCDDANPPSCDLLIQLRSGIHVEIRGARTSQREDVNTIARGLPLRSLAMGGLTRPSVPGGLSR